MYKADRSLWKILSGILVVIVIVMSVLLYKACSNEREEDETETLATTEACIEDEADETIKGTEIAEEAASDEEESSHDEPDYRIWADFFAYKVFYGEWEITREIDCEGALELTEEEADFDFIGAKIKMDSESISLNGETIMPVNPQWNISIVPMEYCHMWDDLNYPLNDEDVFDMDQNFFVNVRETGHYKYGLHKDDYEIAEVYYMPYNFYIKDCDTLIFCGETHYYEAKRTGYVDNLEFRVHNWL